MSAKDIGKSLAVTTMFKSGYVFADKNLIGNDPILGGFRKIVDNAIEVEGFGIYSNNIGSDKEVMKEVCT